MGVWSIGIMDTPDYYFESIVIPDTVTTIHGLASFQSSITIPNSVTAIYSLSLTFVTELTIPDSVTVLGADIVWTSPGIVDSKLSV
jgi:hypothetical protein